MSGARPFPNITRDIFPDIRHRRSLGLPLDLRFIEIALPIAISFMTFHALSYIIDVYHRKIPATRSLVDILLYISFFPHLIAGPIVRAKAFLEQTVRKPEPL